MAFCGKDSGKKYASSDSMYHNPTAVLAADVGCGDRDESYSAEVINTRSALQAAVPEWRDFIASNPRGCCLSNDPAVIEHEVSTGAVSPQVVQIRRHGELKCIAPFSIRNSRLPIQFSVYTLARYPLQLLSLYGTDLIFASDADAYRCCALACESIHEAPFDLGILYSLDSRGELWRYFAAANGEPQQLQFVRPNDYCEKCFRIQLPDTFAEYMSVLSSSTRSTLRRRAKKLTTEHGARLKKFTNPDGVREFLESVEAVFQDAWQARTYGQLQRDCPSEIERLKSIAKEGWLRCYLLESDSGPMAFQIGYQYRDIFYACDFAFARKWADMGPGAVLMYLMMEDLFNDSRPQVVDLGAGDSPQKHTFRGSPFDVGDYWIIPQNRWRFVALAQRSLTKVESSVRSLLVRTKMDAAIRRMLKHKN
jgi:CelD/BcsL family acetyltransferase involved in cellulose biosynthesis